MAASESTSPAVPVAAARPVASVRPVSGMCWAAVRASANGSPVLTGSTAPVPMSMPSMPSADDDADGMLLPVDVSSLLLQAARVRLSVSPAAIAATA